MAPAALLAEALWPATPVQCHNNIINANAGRPNPLSSCINTTEAQPLSVTGNRENVILKAAGPIRDHRERWCLGYIPR